MIFAWDEAKNEALRRERGVSFERIVQAIDAGSVLTILEHPDKAKYGRQRIYILELDGYAYVVPFVDEGDKRFLKTIFPSREYTRLYLRGKEEGQ